MKAVRLIIVIALALIGCRAFSQTKEDLAGKWMHEEIDNSDGDLMAGKDYLDFKADGTCINSGEMYMEMSMDAESRFHAQFTYEAKGTWTLESGVISFKFDPKSITIVQGEGNNLPGILKAMLFNPLMNEMKKEIKKHSPCQIVSFSPSEMVLKATDDKEATEDKYVRQ